VVAERDHVCPGREDPRGELGGDPDTVRRVLAVDDAEPRAELFLQLRQTLLDGPPSGRADDIPDEENLQRTDSSAAGFTDSETLLPASCV
jgi:hypothetical protein